MKNVVLLGAGRVGQAIAYDLSRDGQISLTVVDRNASALAATAKRFPVKTHVADATEPQILTRLVEGTDLVVGALPGHLGYGVLEELIRLGRNVVDISFFPEDPAELDQLARRVSVTVMIDCGVAPGTSNLIVGWAASQLDVVEEVAIYVGGLPVERRLPWEYKAPFSPVDVIEEYTRPARLVENGRIVSKEALSDLELLNFEGLGTLEAFNTDGLRTLLTTIPAKRMREKTLRYPGHAERIRLLRDLGLFSLDPIEVGGSSVAPRELTARLLFEQWLYRDAEPDLTIMRVDVVGKCHGESRGFRYELLDRYDPNQGLSSMARTTGFMASVTARLLLEGKVHRKGVFAPEFLGAEPELFEYVMNELAARGVIYRAKTAA